MSVVSRPQQRSAPIDYVMLSRRRAEEKEAIEEQREEGIEERNMTGLLK